MSRIDRMNQRRNIFIYLLCYHEKGETTVLAEENDVLETMRKKFNSAQDTYRSNNSRYEENTEKNYDDFSLFGKLLPVKFVGDIDLKIELQNHLQTFTHTPKNNKITPMGIQSHGKSFFENRDYVLEDLQTRGINFDTLFHYPWRIVLTYFQEYLNGFFQEKLNEDARRKMLKLSGSFKEMAKLQGSPSCYPFIFIDKILVPILINGNPISLDLIFIIGKRDTGTYNLLDILILRPKTREAIRQILSQINHLKKKITVITSPEMASIRIALSMKMIQ